MTGGWGIADYDPSQPQDGTWGTTISFPVPVPAGMTLQVLDENQTSEKCPGSGSAPTAALGWVCVYTGPRSGQVAATGLLETRHGASIWVYDDHSPGNVTFTGTWAATAP